MSRFELVFLGKWLRRSSVRSSARRDSVRARRVRLVHEPLEERTLLSVDLTGIPNWVEQGQGPVTGGQVILPPNNRVTGPIEAVAAHPTDADAMLVGTVNGGVWRTTNATSATPNWEPLTDQLPSLSMGAIAYSPLDATNNTLFAGTGQFDNGFRGGPSVGLYRTTDGGDTWEHLDPSAANPLNGNRVRSIVPTTLGTSLADQVVLVAAENGGGLFRSTDGGDTFTQISGQVGSGLPFGSASDVIVDPNNNMRYYAALPGQGVFRSDDGGQTWTGINTGLVSAGSNNIEMSAHDAGATTVLYAGVLNGGVLANVFRDTAGNDGVNNDGDGLTDEPDEHNWAAIGTVPNIHPGGQGFNNFSILADQGSPNLVYVGGDRQASAPFVGNLFVGNAATGTWSSIVQGGANNTAPHADSRDMVFDANGNIIEADDGGINRLTSPSTGARTWADINGNIRPAEYYSIGYDNLNNILIGGTQDTGSSEQSSPGSQTWLQRNQADGNTQAVDNTSLAGFTVRYHMSNNFGTFFRRVYDNTNTFQPLHPVTGNVGLAGLDATDTAFGGFTIFPYILNNVNAARMLIGGINSLYESTDRGDNLSIINPAGETGVSSFAYGGRSGGMNNADVIYVGFGGSGNLYLRTQNTTGTGADFTQLTNYPGGAPRDIVLDPEDWQRVYVVDNNQAFFSPDAGQTWTDITGNLATIASNVRSVSLFADTPSPADDVLLVGALGGVFRTLNPEAGAGAVWTKFGADLPNIIANDVQYDAVDDRLHVGTHGRAAWRVLNASDVLQDAPVLNICGDEDHVNQDDEFRLVRDSDNPLMLNVFINNATDVPDFTAPLTAIQQINVFGVGGNDNLIVDSTNGLITVPEGIRYNGDGECPLEPPPGGYDRGFDTLTLWQDDDAEQTSDQLAVGQLPGSGISTIVGDDGTQTVYFEELEPIVDNVPAATFDITGVPGLASLLQDDNQINYEPGALFGNTWGRVTVDNFEPIEFTNKVTLTIDAGAGSDEVNLNNPNTPTALTQIDVAGGDPTGSDRLIVNGTPAQDAVTFDTTGPDAAEITGAGPVPIDVAGIEDLLLNGQDGNDLVTLETPTGADRIIYEPGEREDTGSVLVARQLGVGGGALLGLEFRNLGSDAELTVAADAGVARSNDLEVHARASANGDDRFVLSAAGQVQVFTEPLNTFLTLAVNTPGVRSLTLKGLGGDDQFELPANHPFPQGVFLEGGGPDASDSATITASVTDLVIDLDAETVIELGAPAAEAIRLSGIEHAVVDANTNNLRATIADGDAPVTYQPTGDDTALLELDGRNTLFELDRVGDLLVNSTSDPGERVIVRATENHDVVTIDARAANRTVSVENAAGTTLQPIKLGNAIDAVTAEGRLGNDTFLVVPAPGIDPAAPLQNLLIEVDGGAPSSSDALVIAADAAGTALDNDTHFVVINRSRRADEGVVRVFQDTPGAGNAPTQFPDVSYTDVEVVSPLLDEPVEPHLMILGPDQFEQNEFRNTAAFIGAGSALNVTDLAIFPVVGEHAFVPADNDWFRFVAQTTGTLDIQVYFQGYDTELLPEGGDIDIEVYDATTLTPIAGTGDFGDNEAPVDADERVRIPVVAGQSYFLRAFGRDPAGLNGYDMTIINEAPPTPFDIELDDRPVNGATNPPGQDDNSDTGRSQFDDITYDTTPTVFLRLDDAVLLNDLPGNAAPNSPPDEVIPIPHVADTTATPADPGFRVAIFLEDDTHSPVMAGYAQPATDPDFAGPGVYEFTFPAGVFLPDGTTDGTWFISSRVEMVDPQQPTHETGFGPRSDSLEIIVDTQPPPVFFGEEAIATDGLHPDSDTGIEDQPATFIDRITYDTTPTLWGRAEADAVVRVYADVDGDGELDDTADVLLGETVAIPLDGTNQFPEGQWELTSTVDLNNPDIFPTIDGVRTLFVTAEDVAGNLSSTEPEDIEILHIFVDTRGPQVEDVHLSDAEGYDLFDPKPSTDGPTPPVTQIDVNFVDRPERTGAPVIVGDDAVFVVDVSGSTSAGFLGTPVGDLNSDGLFDTVLDAEIAGFIALNNELIARGLGNISNVSIVAFGSGAASLDMDPATPGVQLSTTPSADTNTNGIPDVEDALRSLTIGGSTNFEAALQESIATITAVGTAPGNGNVVFLSDGVPTAGGAFADEVATLQGMGMNLRAFGVGLGSSLPDLQVIDPLAVQFTSTDEILAALGGGGGGGGGVPGAEFFYPAVNEILATAPGNIRLIGDHNGIIPIDDILFIDRTMANELGRSTVRLIFDEPIPDDRYTLIVSDHITDRPGNPLDGESNASEPHEQPTFPSGDGVPGGDFVARFTVDSRPEIATYIAGSVYVDTNGNFLFDPQNEDQNQDYTNRDLVYHYGFTSDDLFVGVFAAGADGVIGNADDGWGPDGIGGNADDGPDGFDKLAAYGRVDGLFRWLIDTDNDGVADQGVVLPPVGLRGIPEMGIVDPAAINGLPVAGEFNGNPLDGDEVGLFDGATWYLDTDRSFSVGDGGDLVVASAITGYPIVGDFDGDGLDDLGTWTDDRYQFDLADNGFGQNDGEIPFGFLGVRERPVAADFNLDGIDDIGLWVPDRDGQTPDASGEWYFLISDEQLAEEGSIAALNHGFSPWPLGDDLFAQFGDDYALPLFGNSDPPVVRSEPGELVLTGSPGEDTFEFTAGFVPGNWTVTINGLAQQVPDDATGVLFDGLGGNDTVVLTGTAGDDLLDLWTDGATLEGAGFSVTVANVESITADGLTGADTVTLNGSDADELLAGWATGAWMQSAGGGHTAEGFETVNIEGGAGFDIVRIYDSPGDDLLWAAPSSTIMRGPGFEISVTGSEAVHAYSPAGGFDIARLYGTSGDDTMVARGNDASLWGPGYFNRANQFEAVHAYAIRGNDTAELQDSPGDDTYIGRPNEGILYGQGYFNRAKDFDTVTSKSRAGNDTAELTGSTDRDLFVATPVKAEMYSGGTAHRLHNFAEVRAIAVDGGLDEAKLFDSPGNDTFYATPGHAGLFGAGFANFADGFDGVHGYSTAGGLDVAKMFDSPGDDIFRADPVASALYGPGFYNRAKHFDAVHAYATNAGYDTANLTGSDGDDRYVGTDQEGILYGAGFYNRAKHFEAVNARALGGLNDTAQLRSPTIIELAGTRDATLYDSVAWLFDFEQLDDPDDGEDPITPQSVDDVFAAYWA